MRQISLDTETTGLDYEKGHKIIEIGCVEILDRKITSTIFHAYLNPNRNVDESATKITGITNKFLEGKPLFKDIADDFIKFLKDANELIIHNANFDINFINNELTLINHKIKNIENYIKIFDTLSYARKIHPGKKNNLDALCERYNINNKNRKTHGALIDAELLAKIFIEMTSKQININFDEKKIKINIPEKSIKLNILKANKQELQMHNKYIKNLKKLYQNEIV
ncbi:MAG TPA: DNA polymerase III subunit epsilon [Candidatus Azoamicus sp. OHIO1]